MGSQWELVDRVLFNERHRSLRTASEGHCMSTSSAKQLGSYVASEYCISPGLFSKVNIGARWLK